MISSSLFFELRATLAGDRSDLRSGVYHLKLGMTYGAVLSKLTTAPPAARTSELTLTPGRTRRSIDALLRAQHIKGSYLAATRHSPLINYRAYGLHRAPVTLEGFLFPDTYQLLYPVKISDLVKDQLTAFRQNFAKVNFNYARSKHLTPYDVLTIASMVEAEAATTRDRPLVASVIYNRLADGMMLQFDSTTRYATGNYTRPLTVSELHSRSPWNTHTHLGLPPTPIDNPSLAAIQAAAHPAHTQLPVLLHAAVRQGRGLRVHLLPVPGPGQPEPRQGLQEVALTRLGVLGWPVAHSRSPAIQNAALAAAGLRDWRYQLLAVPPPLLAEVVPALPAAGFRGVNVTIPHKQAALALSSDPTPRARAIGAANTLVFGSGGAIAADNTDAPALIGALPLDVAGLTALVLGAGGSARAAVWALIDAGAAAVNVWNRTPERASELCSRARRHAGRRRHRGRPAGQLHRGRARRLQLAERGASDQRRRSRRTALRGRPRLRAGRHGADARGPRARDHDRRRSRAAGRSGGAQLRAVHRCSRADRCDA